MVGFTALDETKRNIMKGGDNLRTSLKQFRIGVHLTQKEFAEKLGICRTTYSHIEQGKRLGTADFWHNLQKTFNVPDEEMYPLQKKD